MGGMIYAAYGEEYDVGCDYYNCCVHTDYYGSPCYDWEDVLVFGCNYYEAVTGESFDECMDWFENFRCTEWGCVPDGDYTWTSFHDIEDTIEHMLAEYYGGHYSDYN